MFSVEYVLRLVASRPMQSYAFSFFGIIDLAAILPFYLAAGIDLQSLRAVRLLRLFRALKLVHYSAALTRIKRAFVIAREELVLFACATMLILYFAAVGIYYFENEAQPESFASVFDGLWWAVVTSNNGSGRPAPRASFASRAISSLTRCIWRRSSAPYNWRTVAAIDTPPHVPRQTGQEPHSDTRTPGDPTYPRTEPRPALA